MSILVLVVLVGVMMVGIAVLFARRNKVMFSDTTMGHIEEMFKPKEEHKIYIDITEDEKKELEVKVKETSPKKEVVEQNDGKQNKPSNKSAKKTSKKKKVKVQKKK